MAIRQLAAPLPAAEIAALRRAVGADSTFAAARRLGIAAHTLTRALAGVGLRAGTQMQIRAVLDLTDPNRGRPMIDLVAEVATALVPVLEELRDLRAAVDALRASSPPRLVSVPEAATMLGVSVSTMWRRVSDGTVPVQRIGRSVRVDAASLRPADPAAVAQMAREARHG